MAQHDPKQVALNMLIVRGKDEAIKIAEGYLVTKRDVNKLCDWAKVIEILKAS